MHSDRGDFWAWLVEILVFACPTVYMLTPFGFPLLNCGIFHKFLSKGSVISLQYWTSTGYFSNSTGSSVSNCRFSPIIAHTVKATSHTRLSTRDHCTSSNLIGGKGGAGPNSLPATLEWPTKKAYMWSLHRFHRGIKWENRENRLLVIDQPVRSPKSAAQNENSRKWTEQYFAKKIHYWKSTHEEQPVDNLKRKDTDRIGSNLFSFAALNSSQLESKKKITLNCPSTVSYHLELRVALTFHQAYEVTWKVGMRIKEHNDITYYYYLVQKHDVGTKFQIPTCHSRWKPSNKRTIHECRDNVVLPT
jgi:hypothetical protein